MTWKKVRKFLNDIHLWLGIASGLILFVVCLTGTIYTFHSEIDEWLNSDKYTVEANSAPMAVEELSQKLEQQVEGHVVNVRIFPSEEKTYQFYVKKEGERRGTTYLVNQYTGDVIGDTKSGASEFFIVMFRLHRWLLLDTSIGRPIVGWSTMIFVFIIVTGLVIWVPQKARSWRQGLKIKWSGNWKRINHDLHNTLGLYTAVFLLIMALTGLQWSFPWYRTGLRSMLGVEQSSGRSQEEPATVITNNPGTLLTMNELIQLADDELPYQGSYRIDIPNPDQNSVKIYKYHSGFFASPASDVLELNAFSGITESKEVFSEKPFNEKVARSIKALHVGDVFGTFSKIIYFITCLIATSMPITGTLIWINKLKKKSNKSRNKRQLVASA